MKTVLILIDGDTLHTAEFGKPVYSKWSHERNAILLTSVILKDGYCVFWKERGNWNTSPVMSVQDVYPTIIGKWQLETSSQEYNYIVCLHAHDLAGIKNKYKNSIVIAINPAFGPVEYPEHYSTIEAGAVGRKLASALSNDIDYVTCQNPRMLDLAKIFYRNLTSYGPEDERFINCFFGFEDIALPLDGFDRYSVRSKYGIKDDEILIINSGGVWKWTDMLTFAQGYVLHVKNNPGTKIKIAFMGWSQLENRDHDEYINKVKKVLSEIQDANKIIAFDNWEEASSLVDTFLRISDFGVNVNTNTLEDWQSHRVRALDYLRYKLPFISTGGDYLSAEKLAKFIIKVRASDERSYANMFDEINAGNYSNIVDKLPVDFFDQFNAYVTLASFVHLLPGMTTRDIKLFDFKSTSPEFNSLSLIQKLKLKVKKYFHKNKNKTLLGKVMNIKLLKFFGKKLIG